MIRLSIYEWKNEWKCEDFKCVWKPTESRLCLTHCQWTTYAPWLREFPERVTFLGAKLNVLVTSWQRTCVETSSSLPDVGCRWSSWSPGTLDDQAPTTAIRSLLQQHTYRRIQQTHTHTHCFQIKLAGYIVWNAHNTVFGSKRSAICAQAVYFLHSIEA